MPSKGVVTASVANLYSQPSQDVDLVTQAVLGTDLSILESEGGWLYVGMPDRYQGWIEAHHVRIYAAGEVPYASRGQVAEVDSLLAFLYQEQRVSLRTPALRVPLGARLEVAQENGDWVQVMLPDASELWVQRGDVVLVAADTVRPRGSIEKVIATAKRFLGLPYLWGGVTPLGIDCSALVQLAYRLNGVEHLLRDAHLQFAQPDLETVSRPDLQAGDLLFFGGEKITHVGLYFGDGQFIHSTTHQRPIVQISDLAEAHWTTLYRGARRP